MSNMAEQRLTIKTSELLTPAGNPGGPHVVTCMLPVEGGRATVFGLFLFSDPRKDVCEGLGRIVRTHLEQAAQSMTGDTNIPRRFETLLGDLNAALALAAEEFPTLNLSQFEGVVGAVTQHQLFTSGLGNLHALYLHKTAERRFVIYELNAQFGVDTEATWEKPFVTILDGELQPGDIFYVATPTPAHSIDLGELQDILVTLPPAGALQRIRQFLPHDSAYGALCFQVAEDDRNGPPKKMNPIASLTALGNTKSETADLLGEQGGDIIGFIKRTSTTLSARLAAPGSRGYKSMLKRLLRAIMHVVAAVLVMLVQAARWTYRNARRVVTSARAKAGTSGPILQHNARSTLTRIRQLPPKSRLLAVSITGVVLTLLFSLWFMGHQSEKKKEVLAFESTVSRIEEKTTAAEASLIYDDVAQARKHLTEAAVLLETLAPSSVTNETTMNSLRENIAAMSAKIRRITNVTPTVVAEATDGAQWEQFIDASGALYAITNDKSVYRLNALDHSANKETTTNGSLETVFTATAEGSNMLLVDDTRQLGRIDTTAKTINPVASGVNNLASANDIVVYNDALYVLASASQQIVKMRAQAGNYEAGTTWISARSSDISAAHAMAIDGNIYLLTATDVLRFKGQRETPWEHESLEPALQDTVDIWTSVDSPYLYILEKSAARVIVFEKENGKLVTQYTASDFSSAVGFVVRENENTIYVATPTKVVSFPANHLLQ